MSLSSRAQVYLASLRRGSFVPVARVIAALERARCPAYDSWLDFHARYAGYEEILGNETAVWGIVHADPFWLDAREASVERDGAQWRVVCADVHPSFDYWLDANGEFSSSGGGGRCGSFDMKVERDSVLYEASAGNRSWELDFELVKVAGSVAELCKLVGADVVPEASDKYAIFWRGQDVIVVERQVAASVWVASDARERVLSIVRGKKASPRRGGGVG